VAKTSFNLTPTVVLRHALSVGRAQSQSPKTACPKVAMSIIMIPKTLHTYFYSSMLSFKIASWGACQPWTHFQDLLVPRSFLINWPFLRLAHLCTPCTDLPCSNCSQNLPGFSASFLNMQADLVFSCSVKNGGCFKFCSCNFVKTDQLHISCIATPQQCTWTLSHTNAHKGNMLTGHTTAST
jgi:hypothetical protein